MAERLGQTITVENNTGGGGGIAASMVTHAPPDGTTMTLLTAGWASGAAVGKFPFDGDNTFGFLSAWSAPIRSSIQVPKDSPIKSFPDLLARAKANPGKITYVDHLARLDLSPDRKLGERQGRRRNGAGALSRLGQCRHRRAGRPRRRDARHRDLGLPARRQRPVPRARGDVAGALSAAARRADRRRDAAGRALHVLARHGGGAAHAAADRRSAQRRASPRAGAARRPGQAQGGRQHRDADHAGGDAPADGRRDRQLEAAHRRPTTSRCSSAGRGWGFAAPRPAA